MKPASLLPAPPPDVAMRQVLSVLAALRVGIGTLDSEADLQERVAATLSAGRIAFERERRIAPGCRIDFLADGGVGIEVKRGKQSSVLPQLERYAAADAVRALVLLTERRIAVPAAVGGKPCAAVVLSYLWGVATR